MSKKANPTVLGLFIILALVLGVGGIILFSSWKIFTKTEKFILYFDASVSGLSPGAPVRFRGVTVGSVRETLIHHNQAPDDVDMPVIIEIDESLIRTKTDGSVSLSNEASFQRLLKQGLRGLLQSQSLITGVLYVELDILPNASPPVFHQLTKEYKEIPTVPTRIQALLENLAEVDFKQMTDQMNSILSRVNTGLGQLNLSEVNHSLTNLLASVNQLVASPEVTNTLASLQLTLNEYRLLSENLRTRIDPLAKGADATLQEARSALADLRQNLQTVHDLLAPRASLRRDLAETLDQLTEAARSIAALADFINRNPNAFLSGRKRPDTEP